MRKQKIIWGVTVLTLLMMMFPMTLQGQSNTDNLDMDDYKIIPDEAIRLRILADSDDKKDQELKRDVRDAVNAEITEWVEELTSIEAARDIIQSRLGDIEDIVENVLEEHNQSQSYTVDFGNVEFPAKLYGSYIYPAGTYEAILITLGEGRGANWWCVLFPPLCFLDFSNGTSVAENEEESTEDKKEEFASADGKKDVEVKFFLFEWFDFL